jgi:hypothetical protein
LNNDGDKRPPCLTPQHTFQKTTTDNAPFQRTAYYINLPYQLQIIAKIHDGTSTSMRACINLEWLAESKALLMSNAAAKTVLPRSLKYSQMVRRVKIVC